MNRRLAVPVVLVLLAACGYYNGMYNTEQLANRARKAEREGRPFDAQSYWGQVAVRAESVLIRHPSAGWADQARLLRGTALARVNACDRALLPLERVMQTSTHTEIAEEAALIAGDCRLKLGDPDGASAAFSRLLASRDRERRSLARYYHGKTLRTAGRYDEALTDLEASKAPEARGERAVALAGLDRIAEALALADSLLAARDTTAPWLPLFAEIAEHDPEQASRLVSRVAEEPRFPASLKARLLLEDGNHWTAGDTLRAERRFRQADSTGRGTSVQAEIRYRLAQAAVTRVGSLEELRDLTFRLEDFSDEAGTYGASGTELGLIARRVLQIGDSLGADSPNGDIRVFLAAELARDSLGARRFAEAQFRRVATEWPASPFAAKALLALLDLHTPESDSLRRVLLDRYGESPYVTLTLGQDTPAYAALEDSLLRFSVTFRPDARQGRPAAPVRRPAPAGPRPQVRQSGPPRQPADN
jgi:tetratricopeptide (TPR) repeat protein